MSFAEGTATAASEVTNQRLDKGEMTFGNRRETQPARQQDLGPNT